MPGDVSLVHLLNSGIGWRGCSWWDVNTYVDILIVFMYIVNFLRVVCNSTKGF